MAAAFGATIVRAPTLVHGEASEVTHDGAGLLEGMPPSFMAARYHSLCVDPATLPPELRVTAMSEVDRVVMGIRHVALPLEGVQFHPESVLTPQGPHLLANFLRQAGEGEATRLDAATGSFATAGLAEPARRHGAAMSDVVRAALATIVDGGTLSMDEARARWARSWTARPRRPSSPRCSWASGCAARPSTSWPGSRRRCASGSSRWTPPTDAIDVVGTGGDGSGTFNISTTAASSWPPRPASPVAKHGNRAITSRAGSADVLDALGVRIDHDAASAGARCATLGFAFLFAPNFHPAMRHAGPTRREIGVRTAFNLLGPVDEPGRHAPPADRRRGPGGRARSPRSPSLLGTERTFVIHGDGVDELPLDGTGVAAT